MKYKPNDILYNKSSKMFLMVLDHGDFLENMYSLQDLRTKLKSILPSDFVEKHTVKIENTKTIKALYGNKDR